MYILYYTAKPVRCQENKEGFRVITYSLNYPPPRGTIPSHCLLAAICGRFYSSGSLTHHVLPFAYSRHSVGTRLTERHSAGCVARLHFADMRRAP